MISLDNLLAFSSSSSSNVSKCVVPYFNFLELYITNGEHAHVVSVLLEIANIGAFNHLLILIILNFHQIVVLNGQSQNNLSETLTRAGIFRLKLVIWFTWNKFIWSSCRLMIFFWWITSLFSSELYYLNSFSCFLVSSIVWLESISYCLNLDLKFWEALVSTSIWIFKLLILFWN